MKKLPAGVITTRADGSQWQQPADPSAEWKQVRDGDKQPQSRAKPPQVEGVGGATSAGALGHRLLRSKYDLDGFMPPDEVHPDHVDVDTDGDMDGKPVLAWQHEGRAQRSYTTNFHQRKHRHLMAAMQEHKVALSNAPRALLEKHREAGEGDKDRYLAAHIIASCGHTPDQMLALQRGHIASSMRKGGKAKSAVLLQHASGKVFQWGTNLPEFDDHYKSRTDRSPTAPLFHCGPDCISSALDEVGLGDVPMQVIRAHAQSRMAVDLLSKSKRTRIDSLGAGLDKVRGAITEASQQIAEYYGHLQAPADMSFVPPHVQAAYLESCGGAGIFKNTYDTLNVRKSVVTQQEEDVWQHAVEQVMKSIPSAISQSEIPQLVRNLFEKMMESPTSLPSKQSSTPLAEETMEETKDSLSLPTPLTTLGTGSTLPTLNSVSPAPLLTSSNTLTPSAPMDSPTAELTSTPSPSPTTGPSQDEKSSSTMETSTPKSETLTRSSLHSAQAPRFDLTPAADLMAAIIMKGADGVIATSGVDFFRDIYSQVTDQQTMMSFMAEVAEFLSAVHADGLLTKAGSVAGTRGDPIGRISVHTDGSRWRKTSPGQWERVGGEDKKKAPGKQGMTQKDSIRVQVLRQRLKSLRQRWQSAQSTKQRAQVVRELTSVKRLIRQVTTGKVKKGQVHDAEDEVLDALLIRTDGWLADWRGDLNRELVAKSEGFVPPPAVRAAARRGLKLRREHKRGGLDTKQAKAEGVGSGVQRASDLASGDALSLKTVKRMKAFFARHGQHSEHREDKTSAAYISWLLWGGNAGKAWANKIVAQQERPKAVTKSEVHETVARMVAVRDTCSDRYLRDYVVEQDHYDVHKALKPADYVVRIARDGCGAATELRTMLIAKGYQATVDHLTTILKEARDGQA